ncbi:MAG: hypothetical protein Ct9H300mP28_35380 [Pseudomonadota bacterium]|nr:MAG: hypothetical protein Ct9H300mP28_35380 [Pseudomonadota bacterium]
MFGGNVVLGMAYLPVDGNLFSARSLGALKYVQKCLIRNQFAPRMILKNRLVVLKQNH